MTRQELKAMRKRAKELRSQIREYRKAKQQKKTKPCRRFCAACPRRVRIAGRYCSRCKPKFHLCLNCPTVIQGHAHYCDPCRKLAATAQQAKYDTGRKRSGKHKTTEPCKQPGCATLVAGKAKRGAVYCPAHRHGPFGAPLNVQAPATAGPDSNGQGERPQQVA
jgi:hypothetical protein